MISSGTMRRILLALLVVSGAVIAARADTTQAYVHFGAFLLGEVPAGSQASRRPRVGYLPIGTVVSYDAGAPKTRIFNYADDVFEDYIRVRSNIGLAGFIRDDLITDLDEREILLPLGYQINVRPLDAHEPVLGQISRAADKHGSTPVEIVGETPEHYLVRLRRGDAASGDIVIGRVSRPLVESGRLVKLSYDAELYLPDIRAGSPAQFIAGEVDRFGKLVGARLDGTDERSIVEYLKQMNALRCRIASRADVEMSGKIFGTGLGLSFDIVLAERNAIYSIKTLAYSTNGQDYKRFYQLHDLRCVDGIPHRLANLILFDVDDPSRQVIVSVGDLPNDLKTNWVRFDTGSSGKMIIVDGVNAYNLFMGHIGKSPYLRGLPHRDRLILSHALLEELAHFSTPD